LALSGISLNNSINVGGPPVLAAMTQATKSGEVSTIISSIALNSFVITWAFLSIPSFILVSISSMSMGLAIKSSAPD